MKRILKKYFKINQKLLYNFRTSNISVIAVDLPEKEEVWLIFKLSFMYYSLLGSLIVLSVGLLVSSITADDERQAQKAANRDLFCPLVHRFLPPPSPQKKLPEEVGLMVVPQTAT